MRRQSREISNRQWCLYADSRVVWQSVNNRKWLTNLEKPSWLRQNEDHCGHCWCHFDWHVPWQRFCNYQSSS
jgi:hypothetical protein